MGRKEISESEAAERKGGLKEARDRYKYDRDLVVDDKESISSLASQLEFPGFLEAGEEIRSDVSSAGEVTDQEFERQSQEAEQKVFTPQKEHEDELSERSDGVSEDISRISSENLNTDASQAKLDEARSAVEQGKDRVDGLKDEQTSEREEGEKDRDDQERALHSKPISFNT